MCGRSCESRLFWASHDVEVISPRVVLYSMYSMDLRAITMCFLNSHSEGGTESIRHVGHWMDLPGWLWWWRLLVEWLLTGETDVLGENLPQRHFVHYKSHLPDPGSNPGCRGGKSATNRLNYGAATLQCVSIYMRYILLSMGCNILLSHYVGAFYLYGTCVRLGLVQ
jgi:hypothetical protein